jgi:hypothetical protein
MSRSSFIRRHHEPAAAEENVEHNKESSDVRSGSHFRYHPKTGAKADIPALRTCATNGSNEVSLNNVVGSGFPLVVAAIIFFLMSTWWRGRHVLLRSLERDTYPLSDFIRQMHTKTREQRK